MNIKAMIFGSIAVIGTSGLLWAGNDGYVQSSEHEGDFYRVSEHEEVRSMQQRGDILSLEEILQRARGNHDGRVLETELEHKRGRYVYEVELLDEQGHVWEMKFDAATGDLLQEERED